MNRPISLSEHHARRRMARALRERDGDTSGSSSGSNNSSGIHLSRSHSRSYCEDDPFRSGTTSTSGVAHDAASFGAFEDHNPTRNPLSRGRRNPRSSPRNKLVDAEHASYTAEACIGSYNEPPSQTTVAPQNRRLPSRGVVAPARNSFSSDPDLDMEDHYSSVSRYGSRCDDFTFATGGSSYPNSSRGTTTSYPSSRGTCNATASSYSGDSFVSVDVGYDASTIATDSVLGEGSGLSPRHEDDEEDAIRAGIINISAFIASYLAGGLSFVVGIFLAIISPILRLLKLIFGDLIGLLGDALGIALRNNPTLYRDLSGIKRMFMASRRSRRRQSRSHATYQNFERSSSHDGHHDYKDCEASVGSSTYTHSTYYDQSIPSEGSHDGPQYVGGWSPSIASSRGSNSRGESHPSTGSYGSSGYKYPSNGSAGRQSKSKSSRSYSSLPQVQENDASSCPGSYYPDDASISTNFSTDSRRLMQRIGSGRRERLTRGSRRGSGH